MTSISPAIVAGTILAAIPLLDSLGFDTPTASAVIKATGAGRTTAYKYRRILEDALPALERSTGRPPKADPPPVPLENLCQVLQKLHAWMAEHTGFVSGTATRRVYADTYRLFVLDLWEEHQDLGIETLAEATLVPLGTLKSWVRGEVPQAKPPPTMPTDEPREHTLAQVETVIDAWKAWHGPFSPFCDHVQNHLRIPFGQQILREILEATGVRIPRRRGLPRPDASALRGGFETFCPNAQWAGDGAAIVVEINGTKYQCNFELFSDTHTGALVGASVRPTEDSAAVIDAFRDGVETTGGAPLAILLDNKPSNHSSAVDEALGETIRLRSRPYTPTDNPYAEGAFGLFRADVPDISVVAATPGQLALEIGRLVVTTWGRATNHRPRADKSGKSRVQRHLENQPTEEELAQAQAALNERLRKQQRAQETRARRLDPIVRSILDDAFERLGLDDPEARYRTAIASWPLDAILEAVAIFRGKQAAGTLPEGADARYLGGITRNLATEAEGMATAEALLQARLDARDRFLASLEQQRDDLQEKSLSPKDLVKELVDRALAVERKIDRLFWLQVTVDAVLAEDHGIHQHLLRIAARRIHSTHKVSPKDRHAAVRLLFAKAVPVA